MFEWRFCRKLVVYLVQTPFLQLKMVDFNGGNPLGWQCEGGIGTILLAAEIVTDGQNIPRLRIGITSSQELKNIIVHDLITVCDHI